jgi:hypothetical protein
MLQQVLPQLADYSTNTVNIGLVEHGDNGANLNIAQVLKISKLVARFFKRIENHILKGRYPDTIPAFTPRDTNSNHKSMSGIAAACIGECVSTAETTMADVSPPSTPACDRQAKKQKLKPGAGLKDFTKAGLFFCKEGTPISDLFPTDLIKKYCSFFAFITRSVPSLARLANLSISAGGTGFCQGSDEDS